MSRTTTYVLGAIAAALVIGAGLSAFASGAPDGLEAAVIKTQCADAPDPDGCLDELAGEPAFAVAPGPLDDYEVSWLSGLVGVALSFAAGAGVLALVRARRRDDRSDTVAGV